MEVTTSRDKIVKSYYAQRQREYRKRKKMEKQGTKKIPKTNAQCQQEFRQKQKKILEQNEALNLARFPTDSVIANCWIDIIQRTRNEDQWKPHKTSVVCSEHFSVDDLYFTKKGLRRLKNGSVPSKCLYLPESQSQVSSATETESSTRIKQEDSSLTENEIKVFCPKCDTEISHTAEGIQQDQTKLLIAKVYHYLEQEYEELKIIYGDLDLTPLSKFRQRTALATGVSETTVLQILKEEEGRNAEKRQETPETPRASKRSRQTDSASDEDSSDDNVDDNEHSSYVHETQMLEVKVEPAECYTFSEEPEIFVPAAVKVEPSDVELNEEQAQSDPISLDVKTEPRSSGRHVVDDEEPEIYVPPAVKAEPIDIEFTEEEKRKELKRKKNSARQRAYYQRQKDLKKNEEIIKRVPKSNAERQRKFRQRNAEKSYMDIANKTLALNEPAGTKRKARKIPRSDVTSIRQHTQGESSTTAAASGVPLTRKQHQSSLFRDTEIKTEEIEIHEEGPS